jgi:hypothetical protein
LTTRAPTPYARRMAKRRAKKPARGGKRAGAGHPVTTGSKSTPVIQFRVGAADYAAAESVAGQHDLGVNELAKRLFLAGLK